MNLYWQLGENFAASNVQLKDIVTTNTLLALIANKMLPVFKKLFKRSIECKEAD
jgi:hypothetical protein